MLKRVTILTIDTKDELVTDGLLNTLFSINLLSEEETKWETFVTEIMRKLGDDLHSLNVGD